MPITHRLAHRATAVLLGLTLLTSVGCEAAGWMAHAVEASKPPAIIEAEYKDLQNRRVAVVVNADYATLYDHPVVQLELATAVTNQLIDKVDGLTAINPRRVVEFQTRNPYWTSATYGELAKRLDAERLVMIDVQEFRTHEPNDVNLYRGVINAHVGVARPDSANLDYSTTVYQSFPPNSPAGVLDADEQQIRFGVISLFAEAVANKFADHEESLE